MKYGFKQQLLTIKCDFGNKKKIKKKKQIQKCVNYNVRF